MSGAFIVLEGPEGGGKTVQARRLATTLERAGHRVVLTREPGGTAVGEAVRGILLGHHDYAILPETEALLMSAARAQHVREVIVPAQERGAVVVCDRYVDSTYAYQGGGRHLERNALATVQGFATGGIEPDLKLLLDLPVEIGLRRRHADPASLNRIDQDDTRFHERVRQEYIRLARQDPDRWVVIDAAETPDEVAAAIVEAVRRVLDIGLTSARAQGTRSVTSTLPGTCS